MKCHQEDSTVLYCTVLYYCSVLYCTLLYCTILYCTLLYCTGADWDCRDCTAALHYSKNCSALTVLHCNVELYCTVVYCTVLYCSVLYSSVLYWLRTPVLSAEKSARIPYCMMLRSANTASSASGEGNSDFSKWYGHLLCTIVYYGVVLCTIV